LSAITFWHNPRCRKSREALQLLEGKGARLNIVKYLETPPSRAELTRVLALLAMAPRDLMRKKEALYKELHLKDPSKTEEDLVNAMADNPILIERPVAIKGDQAVLGRPPEQLLALLD